MSIPIGTAIIIPYRDDTTGTRSDQLNEFLNYMDAYLKPCDRCHIYIIEQSEDGKKFNRGKLLNIGFKLAETANYKHFIFHDVDLLPSKELVSYYTTPINGIAHIAKVWKRYAYDQYFGGVVSFDKSQFEKINGFPNNFWGWGGEDDELYKRVKTQNMTIVVPNKGSFIDLENKGLKAKLQHLRTNKTLKCLNKDELLREDNKSSGLSDLKYRTIKEQTIGPIVTVVTVDILKNDHWTDRFCDFDNSHYGK